MNNKNLLKSYFFACAFDFDTFKNELSNKEGKERYEYLISSMVLLSKKYGFFSSGLYTISLSLCRDEIIAKFLLLFF